MKKLVLSPPLQKKLDRLPQKVESLSYLGEDINKFSHTPIVAIVGTRKPTPYGKALTEELASDLARAGEMLPVRGSR